MSNAELIYAAVVLFAGIPAARWNWTAAALVTSYTFMQGSYYGLGATYPVVVSVLADLTVIAAIYCKRPAVDLFPYPDWKAQAAALWLELSYWDRLVIGLFPVGWVFYIVASNPWWPLFWVSIAQLLAASYEGLEAFHSTRTAKRAIAPEPPSSGFHLVPGRSLRPWVT